MNRVCWAILRHAKKKLNSLAPYIASLTVSLKSHFIITRDFSTRLWVCSGYLHLVFAGVCYHKVNLTFDIQN